MGGVSLVLGMVIARDREEGTVTITPEKYSRSLLERYGIARSNSTYTPGTELSLEQRGKRLPSTEEKQRFQAVTGIIMC